MTGKSHRERKNGRSHELYKEKNRARNSARPKQVFVSEVGWVRPGDVFFQDGTVMHTNWRDYPRENTLTVKQTL